ncbi:MAG TPA: hypothetical protein VFB72_20480 [Verrucomicrobiae bacterium]|nr:hypothetical protein [Verrucomicrobiae bacterium]
MKTTINVAEQTRIGQVQPGKSWRKSNILVVKLALPPAGPRLRKAFRALKRTIPISKLEGFGGEVFFNVEISNTAATGNGEQA